MRKVAVLFGGNSCENEISVLTGVFVLKLLDRTKYIPVPIYMHTDGKLYSSQKMENLTVFKSEKITGFPQVFLVGGELFSFTKRNKVKNLGKIDVALNCCHGGLGEGGGISALIELNEIPLASPELTPSGLFMDKCTTKTVMRGLNVPTLDYIRVNERDYNKRGAFLLKSIEARLKYPVVVKPAHLGSSIGISVARNEEEVKQAIETAFTLDDRVLIEKFLTDKKDVNCAAYTLRGEICVSEAEFAFGDGVYSFEEKYIHRKRDGAGTPSIKKGGDRYALSGELRDKIRAYTKTVYKRMNLKGVVRIDYLISEGKVYLCEVNTVPGSLAYYLFCERISDARRFFTDLIEEAFYEKREKKKVVATGILQNVSWSTK